MQSKPSTPEARIPKAWPFKKVFYGWAIVYAGFIASFGSVPMFGPVLGVFFEPMQEELGWSRATLAFAFTLGSMTSSVSTFVFGRVLDRYGSRAIVVIAGIIIVLAMIGISFMQAPWQFWILFGLGRGSAVGGIQIGVGISIANWFIKRRPRAAAIHQAGLRAGQSLVPLLILGLLAVTGWREAWRLLAVFTAVTIIAPAAVYLRRRPEDLGLHPDGEKPAASASDGPRGRNRDIRDISWTLLQARRTRAFWMIIMFVSMDRFALGAINLHMVINFQDKGLSAAQAVSVLSLFAATSAVTSVPWGFMLEKFHIRYGAMLVSLLLGLSMGVVLIADNYPLAIAFGLVFGLAISGATLVEELLLPDFFGRAHLGAIRGFSAPFRLLAPLGATMAGFIHDWTDSYDLAFTIFAGVFFATLLSMAFATPPQKPRPVEVAVEGTEGT
jgi:sugar phosphate permease